MVALHSPQRTAERIADLVHASSITALHTARILRTATDAQGKRLDLWPQPGSGARITSYTPTQMVNLLLALAAGEPIRGPEVVADFRSLPQDTAFLTHTSRETRHPSPRLPKRGRWTRPGHPLGTSGGRNGGEVGRAPFEQP